MLFSEKDILIIDNAVTADEQRLVLAQLKSDVWRYGWPINNAYFSRPCWHAFIAGSRRPERKTCELELEQHPTWGFLLNFWRRIKAEYIPQATLLGVYANGQTLGQDSPIHRDCDSHDRGTTVLMFCNEHWATCWGGELVFYDHAKENIIMSVLPKPGRVVVFNGYVPHSARSPSVLCDQLRMTIAFKTVLLP